MSSPGGFSDKVF